MEQKFMQYKNSIYIFSLEPIETRYTGQWLKTFPEILEKELGKEYNIENILGDKISSKPTEGAFLNFSDTNIWKNTQINKFIGKVNSNEIKNGDIVIFPDAWHTGIIQLRYLFDLMDFDVKIYSLWHSGSYDPNDFLGRKVKNKKWSYTAEISFFNSCDKNFFATEFHKNLFLRTFKGAVEENKLVVCGFPFDYLKEELEPYSNLEKEDIILFPHRISVEKQIEIFKDLEKSLPEFKFIVCQEQNLSKKQYHELLGKSKIIFSANLQETLGISCYEGYLCNAFPLVPDRLSYSEMYNEKYLSYYTENFEKYLEGKEAMIDYIKVLMRLHSKKFMEEYRWNLKLDEFFTSKKLIKEIKNG